jgi:replication factor C subunit 1
MKASSVTTTKKVAKDAPDLEEAIEEDEDTESVDAPEADVDEEMDLKADKYIKQPKAKPTKKGTKKAVKAGDEDDDVGDGGRKTAKGREKGKSAGGKGKGKK